MIAEVILFAESNIVQMKEQLNTFLQSLPHGGEEIRFMGQSTVLDCDTIMTFILEKTADASPAKEKRRK
jgi:hypothetical protein